jgi:type VI protein secretion system component Hcp
MDVESLGIELGRLTFPTEEGSPPDVRPRLLLSLRKKRDKATPALALAVSTGQLFPEAKIELSDGTTRLLTIDLTEVIVATMDVSSLSETLSIRLDSIEWEYNFGGPRIEFGWDLVNDREL